MVSFRVRGRGRVMARWWLSRGKLSHRAYFQCLFAEVLQTGYTVIIKS